MDKQSCVAKNLKLLADLIPDVFIIRMKLSQLAFERVNISCRKLFPAK